MKRKSDIRFCLGLAAALVVLLVGPAGAANSECERLRRAIAESERAGQNSQYQAAAERQRSEISRTVAYAHQIGCENKKFLFFGSDPPAQCGQLNAQIGRMRENLDDLQAKGGGGGGASADLVARYNAQCSAKAKSPNVLDALFGQPKSNDLEEQPLAPGKNDDDAPVRNEPPATGSTGGGGGGGGDVVAGGKAVCVRSCDGAFFPVSYSASSDRVNSLSELCRALCPNAEVTVYTLPSGGEIEQAVSVNGARYMESPTALRYRHVYDSSCTCRRRGQTWNDALASAESLLGKQGASDIIVTAAKSAELSRPKADPKADAKAKAKAAKADAAATAAPTPKPTPPAVGEDRGRTDQNGIDTVLRDAAEAISRDGSGISDPAAASDAGPVHEGRGRVFDQKGADGATHKVRVVGD